MRQWMHALLVLAGLLGATGIGAAALAAHRSADPDLQIAAYFLLIHATAIAGIAAQQRTGFLAAASILALGAVLFCGDLMLRALAGTRFFALAAPTGGTLMILGWLMLTVASARALSRRDAA
jgi:uncharacterized membrane protein YgdD (TMEM256/DUF423 family)